MKQYDEYIKELFLQANGKCNRRRLQAYIDDPMKDPIVTEWIENRYPQSESIEETMMFLRFGYEERKKCDYCGKTIPFIRNTDISRSFCSNECQRKHNIERRGAKKEKLMKSIKKDIPIKKSKTDKPCMKESSYRTTKSMHRSYEFALDVWNKFGDKNYETVRETDFPSRHTREIKESYLMNELKSLMSDDSNQSIPTSTGGSKIIQHFHKSIIYANRNGMKCPYDAWQDFRLDKEKFKKMFINRIQYSDYVDSHPELLVSGDFPTHIWNQYMSVVKNGQTVSYFKPRLAKYIITRYLNEYNTIFDPFSGYSGRLLGAIGAKKNYIGQDLCISSVDESNQIIGYFRNCYPESSNGYEVRCADSTKTQNAYECLFTCSPYSNTEQWPGIELQDKTCDEWIDVCLKNYDCERYVFVVDENIQKYRRFIKETIENKSHFGKNYEFIVVINKSDIQ